MLQIDAKRFQITHKTTVFTKLKRKKIKVSLICLTSQKLSDEKKGYCVAVIVLSNKGVFAGFNPMKFCHSVDVFLFFCFATEAKVP